MKILGIESSSLAASVAVVTDDVLTAEFTINFKKTHSQTLLPMLEQLDRMIELDKSTLDAIAVAAGPGSFTGLRIGAATAKGLGLALGKPLAAVPTLDALACNLWGCGGIVCPILDARRDQVYTGAYHVAGEDVSGFMPHPVIEQCAVDIRELLEKLEDIGEPVVFLGDGVPVFRERIEAGLRVPFTFAPAQNNQQRAASVAALGLEYVRRGKTVSAAAFRPEYLRKSQAEREREERRQMCGAQNHMKTADETEDGDKISF